MFRKALNLLFVLPLAIVFVIFAVANRHFVTVSFDPFNTATPALTLSLPLFIVILLAAIAGVIAGGVATWFRQRHWRRSVRRHEAEALQARREADDRRGGYVAPVNPGAMLGPPL